MDDTLPEQALEAGRGYETLFVPALFAPWAANVCAAAGLRSGDRILDVACGTGVLARRALATVGNTGAVVGLDAAPGMIAAAREVEPGIDWVIGEAESLPFADGIFDAVISQFGIMFFQDRQRAAKEMHRVAKRGGKLAVAAWHGADRNPAYRDIAALLDEHLSRAAGDAVRAPFCLGDPKEAAGLLAQAGFDDISIRSNVEQARFPSLRTMVEAELRGWLPIFGIHLDDERIAGLLDRSEVSLATYASSDGEAVFPTSAYIVTATKR